MAPSPGCTCRRPGTVRLDPWKDRLLPVGPWQLPRDIPLHPSQGACEEDTYDLPCFQMKKLMVREMKESAPDLGGGNGNLHMCSIQPRLAYRLLSLGVLCRNPPEKRLPPYPLDSAAQTSKLLPLLLPAPAIHALLLTTVFPTGGQGFWCWLTMPTGNCWSVPRGAALPQPLPNPPLW